MSDAPAHDARSDHGDGAHSPHYLLAFSSRSSTEA